MSVVPRPTRTSPPFEVGAALHRRSCRSQRRCTRRDSGRCRRCSALQNGPVRAVRSVFRVDGGHRVPSADVGLTVRGGARGGGGRGAGGGGGRCCCASHGLCVFSWHKTWGTVARKPLRGALSVASHVLRGFGFRCYGLRSSASLPQTTARAVSFLGCPPPPETQGCRQRTELFCTGMPVQPTPPPLRMRQKED